MFLLIHTQAWQPKREHETLNIYGLIYITDIDVTLEVLLHTVHIYKGLYKPEQYG